MLTKLIYALTYAIFPNFNNNVIGLINHKNNMDK